MKISFDFDSTLSEERLQKVAEKFIDDGHDIWIVTSRWSNNKSMTEYHNRDILYVAKKLNISEKNIIFTEGRDKWIFLEDFDLHFDDDQIEVELIEENLKKCLGVLIYDE